MCSTEYTNTHPQSRSVDPRMSLSGHIALLMTAAAVTSVIPHLDEAA
jgi:hypothetical protein